MCPSYFVLSKLCLPLQEANQVSLAAASSYKVPTILTLILDFWAEARILNLNWEFWEKSLNAYFKLRILQEKSQNRGGRWEWH